MTSYVTITLDTTAPASPSINLENGQSFANSPLVNAYIGTGDATTTNYQMLIWGDVDPLNDANVQTLEVDSSWISFQSVYQIKVTDPEGIKTVYVRIRDDVNNESGQAQDSITLDLTKPVVEVTTPDLPKISKIPNKNVSSFSFTVDVPFEEYAVKVVNSPGAAYNTGSVIPTTAGSTNTSGTGAFNTSTAPINVSITGTDLEAVSAGDGDKYIKVFVRDEADNWSA